MNKFTIAIAAAGFTLAVPVHAATYAVFDDFDDGIASFNAVVAANGVTATTKSLTPGTTGTNLGTTDFTITRPSGNAVNVGNPYYLYSSSPGRYTSGGVIDISPSGSSRGIGSKNSGLTFTFANAINALGFEVGDWATCCQPSDLYIQFGNSTPILLGESNTFGDQFLTNGGAGVFVGAFDNSDTFTSVTFWGDGWGEYLVAGGTIRYAIIGQGGVIPGGVPEPATWAMLILGFGVVGSAVRRRQQTARLAFA